jgi:hypothetical protein
VGAQSLSKEGRDQKAIHDLLFDFGDDQQLEAIETRDIQISRVQSKQL